MKREFQGLALFMHGQSILIDLAGFKRGGMSAYPAQHGGYVVYSSHKNLGSGMALCLLSILMLGRIWG